MSSPLLPSSRKCKIVELRCSNDSILLLNADRSAMVLESVVEVYSLTNTLRQRDPKHTRKLIVGGLFGSGRIVEESQLSWRILRHIQQM
jgi:hypothetical protein